MNSDFDRIGVEFAPPGRAHRIDALLEGRSGLTTDDLAAIHRDVLAGQPAVLADAVAGLTGLDGEALGLQQDIVSWDQQLHADSVSAAAYVAIRDELVQRLADHPRFAGLRAAAPYGELLEPWFVLPVNLYLGLRGLLSSEGRQLLPDLDDLLTSSVEAVAADRPGRWGERHVYRPLHVLGHELSEPPGVAGDNDCVRCTGSVPGSDTAYRGSVARYVWDLAGFDSSGWVVPLGASGDPEDPHHHDQTAAWVEGTLLPVAHVTKVADGDAQP